METHSKIDDTLFLVTHSLPKETQETTLVELPTNHIAVIDCSGSMWNDLPKIRSQLKNKLPFLMKDGDTFTVIWFSGKNEFGVIVEELEINTAKDLSNMNAAIDKFLRPMGLTGFVQPLNEVGDVIERISVNRPNSTFSMFFLTDGYDNQWSVQEILNACERLQLSVSTATFIEYGYYCNRPLMTQMAEQTGGSLIFSENFVQYEPVFEAAMQNRPLGAKKVEVKVQKAEANVAFTIENGNIISHSVRDGSVFVPEGTSEVYYFTDKKVGKPAKVDDSLLYAGMFIFAQRMKSDEVFKLLRATGDVRLIKMFSNCFGKQKYSDFQKEVLDCTFNAKARLSEGCDPTLVPDDDAFTVLDLLEELTNDDDNLFFPNHPSFQYNRIGRKTIESGGNLSDYEQNEIEALLEKAKTVRQLQAVQKRLDAILASKPKSVQFRANDLHQGYPISKLVTNESRPNISALIRIDGVVDLPENEFGLPTEFPSNIYRNYTIIRDGVVNVDVLPVSLSRATFLALKLEGVVSGKYDPDEIYEINLRSLPVINRRMVNSVSAKELFTLQYNLMKLKGKQKVYNHYLNEATEKTSKKLVEQYGAEAESWLRELGITDSGFNPKRVQDESTDVYTGKELKVSIKGLSSLPKVEDVKTKLDAGKSLTISQRMLVEGLQEVKQTSHDVEELATLREQAVKEVRELNRRLSEIKFSVVVGQVWFSEFSSLDENSLEMEFDGEKVKCTVDMKEIAVKI